MKNYPTLIVDVTYRCNSPCFYCQWGDSATPGREDCSDTDVLISDDILKELKIERVVFSGGEPLLRRDLESILRHYSSTVRERVVITNGLLLEEDRARELLLAGATGFAFSVDSFDADTYKATRGWPEETFRRVLRNLEGAAERRDKRSFELGINCTVASCNSNWNNVREVLKKASDLQLDYVKFLPVFDDGYLGRRAPHLRLGKREIAALEEIAEKLPLDTVKTNPPGFWLDLADLARSRVIPGDECGLGELAALAVRGRVSRCFWVPDADIGDSGAPLAPGKARRSLSLLEQAKRTCRVGPHCFCLQTIDHEWSPNPRIR